MTTKLMQISIKKFWSETAEADKVADAVKRNERASGGKREALTQNSSDHRSDTACPWSPHLVPGGEGSGGSWWDVLALKVCAGFEV